MDEEMKKTCSPDYEALYHEYADKCKFMYEKCHNLELKLQEEHEQKMILAAQMEVVRLIFGGAENG